MRKFVRLAVLTLVVGSAAAGLVVLAKPPGGGGGGGGIGGGCPRQGIYCLDVWNPVICSDGVVYSNSCYAYVACATGCVPYGGDSI
jgi:hypothetical protein